MPDLPDQRDKGHEAPAVAIGSLEDLQLIAELETPTVSTHEEAAAFLTEHHVVASFAAAIRSQMVKGPYAERSLHVGGNGWVHGAAHRHSAAISPRHMTRREGERSDGMAIRMHGQRDIKPRGLFNYEYALELPLQAMFDELDPTARSAFMINGHEYGLGVGNIALLLPLVREAAQDLYDTLLEYQRREQIAKKAAQLALGQERSYW